MKANPYQSPPELSPKPIEDTVGVDSFSLKFETDWSAAGLRARRTSRWAHPGDLGFAALTVIWLWSLLEISSPGATGWTCFLTPAWVLLGIVWLSSWTFRSGYSFPKRFPALAGRVTGMITGGQLVLDGPAVTIVVPTHRCAQCSFQRDRGFIRPPGIDETMPVVAADIHHVPPTGWGVDDPLGIVEQVREFDSGSPSPIDPSQTIRIEGTLRGSDFRSLSVDGYWKRMAWMLGGAATVMMVVCGLVYLSLDSWVRDPPVHYQLSLNEQRSVFALVPLSLVALISLSLAVWNVAQRYRNFGEFAALVRRDLVAITQDDVTFAYHGKSLEAFVWSDAGLRVLNRSEIDCYLLPAHCFDDHQRVMLAQWFDRPATPPPTGFYLGPKI